MKLTHMPYGITPFADFGYERYPVNPLLGDEVSVGLMIEGAKGEVIAQLSCELDGVSMPSQVGRRVSSPDDGRLLYVFSLGKMEGLHDVTYRFTATDEEGSVTTKSFGFRVLSEDVLSEPICLLREEYAAYAVFRQLITCLDWSDGLHVRTLSALPDSSRGEGTEVDAIHEQLDGGLVLHVQKNPFVWELKRYTNSLVRCDGLSYKLLVDRQGLIHRVTYSPSVAGKHVVGLGERFDSVDQKGNQLLCRVVEKFCHQGQNSYIPIPFFFTDQSIGWHSSTRRRLWFDAGECPHPSPHLSSHQSPHSSSHPSPNLPWHLPLRLSFETPHEGVLTEEWWLVGDPKAQLAQLHELTGNAVLPPKWAFGVWISSNGWNTQKEAMEQLEALARESLPATAMVLEAWSDERTFYIFNGAQHRLLDQEKPCTYEDFVFPEDGQWPDPKAMMDRIRAAGLNLILWQIPVIKHTDDPGQQLLSDEAYAIQHKYCVMNDDGTPYRITDCWFGGSLLLDFSNPEAVKWWFSKRRYLLDTLGVKGFKTDGGEFLFDDTARLHDGQTGATAHNSYPGQYIAAYNRFLAEHGVQGITYSRAGYTGAQTQSVHWSGDQLSEWSEVRAQLTAVLSAGLSGIPFMTFDLAGFAGPLPSPELYLRSVAMAAFTPIMQWHSEPRSGQFFATEREWWNNDRSPWNLASLYQDERIIPVYRMFANFHMNLLPYIYQEAMHCVRTARPMMAHLLVDYPDDPESWNTHDQYMLGRDLLVAPVLEERASERKVYLPQGVWHDLFRGGTLAGGQVIDYQCPLNQLPVFVRDGAAIAVNLNKNGIMGTEEVSGSIGNDLANYTQLAFLCFGDAKCEFEDDLGNRLSVRNGRVTGTGVSQVGLIDANKAGHSCKVFGRGLEIVMVTVERS
jgi:alpha-D-xyloside xylohydrolase